MRRKIAFAGDLHKRATPISTIKGYCEVNDLVQRSLMKTIDEKAIDTFVSLGDWYDKGFGSDVSAALYQNDLDIQMANQLNGEFYGVIGNHIKLRMDSNPELHLIQPHKRLHSRHDVERDYQIIRTPEVIRFGKLQISLMHYNDTLHSLYDYKPIRQEGVFYHIAVFHKPDIIPSAYLSKVNTVIGQMTSSNSDIARVLTGVDMVIVGDIHKPLGMFDVSTTNGVCKMIVPGSLTNTDSGIGSRHSHIYMPIVEYKEDDKGNPTVELEMHKFDLFTNKLKFVDTSKVSDVVKMKTLRGNTVLELNGTSKKSVRSAIQHDVPVTLNEFFIKQGYTNMEKELVKSIKSNPTGLDNLIKIYKEGRISNE